jgi:hypothetical protein
MGRVQSSATKSPAHLARDGGFSGEMPNESNLIPIKPGQQLALKRPEDRKTERIPIQVTKSEKQRLEENAKLHKLSLSAYLLKDK